MHRSPAATSTAPTGLYFSHPGITAEPAGPNKFKVTVAADVPVGPYDVRVVTPLGLSNFRAFVVGDWPEVVEKEPNNEPAQAQRVDAAGRRQRPDRQADRRRSLRLRGEERPAHLHQLLGLADRQPARRHAAWSTTPRARSSAYSGDYYGKDPFIDFTAPADGDYIVKVWDFVYGGGSDYFYRLHIGSLPHLDAVIPAAVQPGEKTTVTLYRPQPARRQAGPGRRRDPGPAAGDDHPRDRRARRSGAGAEPARAARPIRPAQATLDGMAYRLTTPEGSSNPIFLAFTDDPDRRRAGAEQRPRRRPSGCRSPAT